MDIKCKICGEPWDMDTLHEAIEERYPEARNVSQSVYEEKFYNPMKERFFKDGCRALGSSHNGNENPNKELWDVAYSEFGDDLDGVATIMEDMGL